MRSDYEASTGRVMRARHPAAARNHWSESILSVLKQINVVKKQMHTNAGRAQTFEQFSLICPLAGFTLFEDNNVPVAQKSWAP